MSTSSNTKHKKMARKQRSTLSSKPSSEGKKQTNKNSPWNSKGEDKMRNYQSGRKTTISSLKQTYHNPCTPAPGKLRQEDCGSQVASHSKTQSQNAKKEKEKRGQRLCWKTDRSGLGHSSDVKCLQHKPEDHSSHHQNPTSIPGWHAKYL